MTEDALVPADDALYLTVQCFLAREAALLDGHRYRDWLALLDSEIAYRVTVPAVHGAESVLPRIAILDESHGMLATRVRQLENPRLTRAENPRTITRRLVSNIEAFRTDAAHRLLVRSNLLIFRGARPGNQTTGVFSAGRTDTLALHGGAARILTRTVDLDHPVLDGGIVSTFF